MANEFTIRNGFISKNNSVITGSLIVSNSIDSGNRYLYDVSGYYSVDWNNRVLRDGSAQTYPSIDWSGRQAIDASSVLSIDWNTRVLNDTSDALSIDWENRTLNSNLTWDDSAFYPVSDDSVNLGINSTNRFRYGYFARAVQADGGFYGNLEGSASFALSTVSSSVTTVERGSLSAASSRGYLTSVLSYDADPTHRQLLVIEGGGYFSSSFGILRLHTPSVVATIGFTGSLQGTATTASYISPTFISASAAASGFGSGGGGTSTPGTNLGLVYAVSLGYLMP